MRMLPLPLQHAVHGPRGRLHAGASRLEVVEQRSHRRPPVGHHRPSAVPEGEGPDVGGLHVGPAAEVHAREVGLRHLLRKPSGGFRRRRCAEVDLLQGQVRLKHLLGSQLAAVLGKVALRLRVGFLGAVRNRLGQGQRLLQHGLGFGQMPFLLGEHGVFGGMAGVVACPVRGVRRAYCDRLCAEWACMGSSLQGCLGSTWIGEAAPRARLGKSQEEGMRKVPPCGKGLNTLSTYHPAMQGTKREGGGAAKQACEAAMRDSSEDGVRGLSEASQGDAEFRRTFAKAALREPSRLRAAPSPARFAPVGYHACNETFGIGRRSA